MGRGSFKGGNVFAQNLQSGKVNVTLDGKGDGTATITFDHPMKNVPVIVPGFQQRSITGVVSFSSITNVGCTVTVDGSSVSSDVDVGYVAFDDSFN
jgi:hypothetical protein